MLSYLARISKKIIRQLRSIFLNGFFTLLPIILTIAIFNVSFNIIKSWIAPICHIKPTMFFCVPHAEILLAIIFIFLVGIILKFFIIKSIVQTVEKLLFNLPLIRPVYSGIKQLVITFDPNNNISFQKIVAVEFPRPGIYSIGFLTNKVSSDITPKKENQYFSIFIPTTPNPTSGFFVLVPEDQIITMNLTQQEAMALIISGGIIQPERFTDDTKEQN